MIAAVDPRGPSVPSYVFTGLAPSRYVSIAGFDQVTLSFAGKILLVSDANQAPGAVAALYEAGAAKYGVGIDMEWQPEYSKSKKSSPTALIQVATGARLFVAGVYPL